MRLWANIDHSLIPIKLHYFLFLGAIGSSFPQLYVTARQIGVSPDVIGYISLILRLLLPIKSIFGYLIDYFPNTKKCIFMIIVSITFIAFSGLAFIPNLPGIISLSTERNITVPYHDIIWCNEGNSYKSNITHCGTLQNVSSQIILSITDCKKNDSTDSAPNGVLCKLSSEPYKNCFYSTMTFWFYVIVVYISEFGHSISNNLSTIICFEILGDQKSKFGSQIVWGVKSYGLAGLIGGTAVYWYKTETIAPALVITITFGILDVIVIKFMKLPYLAKKEKLQLRQMRKLLSQKLISICIIFATMAGVLKSFNVYYLFWHLEEVADKTNYINSIKLIEGCVIAAQCFGSNILFVLLSGKIFKNIGYANCLSLCFLLHGIRFFLVSIIPNPWWLGLIEFAFSGCTSTLTFTCIVTYASEIAPFEAPATVQALISGMFAEVGYAIGSVLGGQIFKSYGGQSSFQIFSLIGVITSIAHMLLMSK